MSNRFNHIQPPNQFKYREGRTVLKQQYDFKCDNRIYFSEDIFRDLHNHSYRLYVDVLSPIGDYGLGLDFNEVDAIYNKVIEPKLNHQLINETLPDMNTTLKILQCGFGTNLNNIFRVNIVCMRYNDRGVSLNRSIMKL